MINDIHTTIRRAISSENGQIYDLRKEVAELDALESDELPMGYSLCTYRTYGLRDMRYGGRQAIRTRQQAVNIMMGILEQSQMAQIAAALQGAHRWAIEIIPSRKNSGTLDHLNSTIGIGYRAFYQGLMEQHGIPIGERNSVPLPAPQSVRS